MTNRDIRALLRGATFCNRIDGWYGGTESLPDEFYWHPSLPGMKTREQAEAFAVQLFKDGVDPLYTELEPRLEEAA